MIGDLVVGKERSKLIVIEDSLLQSGRPLVLSLICNLCTRVEKVHVICYDRNPSYLREEVPEELLKRVVVHDGFQDVLGWNNPEGLSVNTDLVQYLQNKPGYHGNHTIALVIDSLSPMMLHRAAPYTCQTISRLTHSKIHTADTEQVVCLVHGDLHDNHSLTLVEHLATSVVKVQASALDHFLMASQILHKRISGKIIKITEHFNLSEKYEVLDVTEIKSVDQTTSAVDTGQTDPTANLTFNLTLTDKEKMARSQVKLPYTYDRNRQDDTLNKSVGEGKIFYQPDEADDFDEEDPDDDLDI